jgi:ribonuclease T2
VILGRWRLALAGALALLALPAHSQPPREIRGAPTGQFDFYVLALSWSPGFCATDASASDRDQCAAGSGLGFVVHGLWPQNEQGYPSFCQPGGRSPSRPALEEAKGVYPDEGLARYEWRRHGSCAGLSPVDYFRATRRARELVRIPDSLNRPTVVSKALPLEIERAFSQSNPGLRPDMIAVQCGRRVLQEVRICLDKDLRGFRSCPEVDRDGCRSGEITVTPVR